MQRLKFIHFVTIYAIIYIYVFLAFLINRELFGISYLPYFNYLADAFLHGRLHIINPQNTYDLILFRDKLYLFWGPAPLLFIIPFYLFFGGLYASDVFYTLVAGTLNIILFALIITEFKKFFRIKLTTFDKQFLVLNFAFCSPNLFLSLTGKIWFTEQVVATFYFLVFLLFYFKYLNTTKLKFLLGSVLFFNLAWMSRYTLIFYAILFVFPLLFFYQSKNNKQVTRILSSFFLLTSFFLGIIFMYNYIRFGNIIEFGLKYEIASTWFHSNILSGKMFSLGSVATNAKTYFLEPVRISLKAPYIVIRGSGNSIFSFYPLVFFMFYFFKKKYLKNRIIFQFLFICMFAIAITMFASLLYLATGGSQLGRRYFLDIAPVFYLLTLFVLNDVPLFLKILFLTYGIYVNIAGTLLFYGVLK